MVSQPRESVGLPPPGSGWDLLSPEVLQAATEKLPEATGRRATQPWAIVEVDHRRKSTVLRLATVDEAGETVSVFYKIAGTGASDRVIPVSPSAQGLALKRLIPLTEIFNRLTAGSNISAAPILAVDRSTKATVTLSVSGRPMTSFLGGVRPTRSLHLGRTLFLLGRACRKLEDSNEQWPEQPEPAVEAAVAFIIDRFGDPLEQIPGGHSQLLGLAEEVVSRDGATIFGHGDLFGSNVLVEGPRVNLIDFGLAPQLKMHDLSYIAFRTAGHTRLTTRRRRHLISKLLEGYGLSDLEEDPGWRLARALMVLRHLGRARSRSRAVLAGTTDQLAMLLEERDPWLTV